MINTGIANSTGIGLAKSADAVKSSLLKLASGSKINKSSDDAGGLAVSMKLDAAISRTYAVQSNVGSAMSYLQTQDSSLSVAGNVLSRMSQLKMMSQDPTKSASDIANYQAEFSQLQGELQSINGGTFNGQALFGSVGADNTLSVSTSEDGTQSTQINKALLDDPSGAMATVKNSSNDMASISSSMINDAISQIANFRAQAGASMSGLSFANDTLTANAQNLQSANSRIADTDVAQESTNLATYQILYNSGMGMLAQANLAGKNLLKLIEG